MEKNFLIVGHGLAGCVLALTFFKRGIPFSIVGSTQPGEASMASSGLINPVTGRRYVKAWMIDELIDKAREFYSWTEMLFGSSYFFPVDIVRFLSNQEAVDAWRKRQEDTSYSAYISEKRFDELDKLRKPYGVITGGFRLDTPAWLNDARNFLIDQGLLTIGFEPIEDGIVQNKSIIYATGAVGKSMSEGIIPNKGEALIVRLPGWTLPGIIKGEIYFIPLKEKDMFWVGSHYQRWPEDSLPTDEGRKIILEAISKVYPAKVEVIDHLAGIRPTVDDRRPIIGPYPGYPGMYLFNGLGTKGTSLAPYWSDLLISYLIEGKPLPSIVSPSRYSGVAG